MKYFWFLFGLVGTVVHCQHGDGETGDIKFTSTTVGIVSQLQSLKTKTEQVKNTQNNLEIRMTSLENRLEDKMEAGFKRIEDKLCDLESKTCAGESGVEQISNSQTQTALLQILDTAKNLEGSWDAKMDLLLPLITNNATDQICKQVMQFLVDNLTAEINEISRERASLTLAMEERLSELITNFDTILKSMEGYINTSLSNGPQIPPEFYTILQDLLKIEADLPQECKRKEGLISSSVIEIQPYKGGVLSVPYLCDMVTDGGGWIIIQRRSKGDTDFFRTWDEYKTGFGTLKTDFWLGNDNIHALTSNGTWELYVELKYAGETKFSVYQNFYIEDEASKYTLHVGAYSGTAGESLLHHNRKPFSTKDNDNDYHAQNCAELYEGAWWYNHCHISNLNGIWNSTQPHHGLMWRSLTSADTATFSEMKIRKLVP